MWELAMAGAGHGKEPVLINQDVTYQKYEFRIVAYDMHSIKAVDRKMRSMKTRVAVLAIFLVFTTAPFALAQRGEAHFSGSWMGHTGDDSTMVGSQRVLLMPAMDIQREAFAYCMTATKAAHKLIGRMPDQGSYWRVRRNGPYDLSAASAKREQLESSLNDMVAAHRHFLQTLSQEQDAELGSNLSNLEQLQADLDLEMPQLDKELGSTRPDSFLVSRSIYRIGKTINKWHSQHKKIAKKLGVSKS